MILQKIMENKQPDNRQSIFELIERITPLYNSYRDSVKSLASGTDVLVLMWKVGDIIDLFVNEHDIKPHALYWQIYGKAEGLKQSYITRDFLSYCLRIRRYFSSMTDISERFPHLRKYSLFREAFPLLENPKFKLSKDDEDKIITVLNSGGSLQKIKQLIQAVKSQHIGIKNTRKQKLNEMKPIADNFVAIYNEIYSLIKNNNQQELDQFAGSFSKDLLSSLSEAVSALTQENLYIPELTERKELPAHWILFIQNLIYLLKANVETRNRFRRLVPPRKLFNLADMLNVVTLNDGVKNYKKRKNIQ